LKQGGDEDEKLEQAKDGHIEQGEKQAPGYLATAHGCLGRLVHNGPPGEKLAGGKPAGFSGQDLPEMRLHILKYGHAATIRQTISATSNGLKWFRRFWGRT
jgi:hypothetical protein